MPLAADEVADRLEIQDALALYAHAVDTHDWDLLDEVFLPDADIDYRESVPYRGDLAYTKQWLSRMTKPGNYYHLLGLPRVVVSGQRATSRTACYNPMPLRGDPDGRRLVGHWYLDDWVRTLAGWRIGSRTYRACYQLRVASDGTELTNGAGIPLPPNEILRIHELYAKYNQAIDAADADGYVRCFTAGGRLVRNESSLDGYAALAEFASGASTRGLKHFVSNVTVEGTIVGSTSGSATGRADVVVLARRDDALQVATAGSYADQLVCGPAGWQFSERRYVTGP